MKITATIIGHWILIFLIIYFSFQLISTPAPWILPDALNLGIHEVGHLVFLPFGMFMHMIGGSLLQTIIPVAFFVYFLMRAEYFSVCVMLFWIADNVVNVSVYMRDAQVMHLPLLGGDGSIHDWNWLFTQTGLLQFSQPIGTVYYLFGVLCLLASIIGMIYFTLVEMELIKPMRIDTEEIVRLPTTKSR